MEATSVYVLPDAAEVFGRMDRAVRALRRRTMDRQTLCHAAAGPVATGDDGAPAFDWPTVAVVVAFCLLFAGISL